MQDTSTKLLLLILAEILAFDTRPSFLRNPRRLFLPPYTPLVLVSSPVFSRWREGVEAAKYRQRELLCRDRPARWRCRVPGGPRGWPKRDFLAVGVSTKANGGHALKPLTRFDEIEGSYWPALNPAPSIKWP